MKVPDCEIASAGQRFRNGSLTSETLTRSCLEGIRALEPTLRAFITLCDQQAIDTAKARDRELAAGLDRGFLHGIPIVYKDNIDTARIRTTVGSELFADRIPQMDAELVTRLTAAGAVLLGKTNMNEFAAGGPGGHNAFFGTTRNPWNTEHESGGSSSGTGASVASGLCLGGIGSDSGGSIRGPASHMGIVGLRPTFGRVSAKGVFPRARTLDICGPMARKVADAALIYSALIGDSSLPGHFSVVDDLEGTRIGLLSGFVTNNVDTGVKAAFDTAVTTLVALGAQIVDIRLPELESGHIADVASDLLVFEFARSFGEIYCAAINPTHIGPIVHRDMERGRKIHDTEYRMILEMRKTFAAKLRKLFEAADMMVTPTMPTTAPPIATPDLSGKHRQFTIPFSFAGYPACSIPCGLDQTGLPMGLQFIGDKLQEARLLEVAAAYERATEQHRTPSHYHTLPIG